MPDSSVVPAIPPSDALAVLVDAFAERLAAALAPRLAELLAPSAPERIPLADVETRYGVHPRWIVDRHRQGLIAIGGARGRRYVNRGDLEALLASTVVRRQSKAPPSGPSVIPTETRSVVVDLAARRARAA